MLNSSDQHDLIMFELQKLRAKLTDEDDPVEIVLFAFCLGELCKKLLTRVIANGNFTIAPARSFLLGLARTVGAYPCAPTDPVKSDGHLRGLP